jgi:hypothetical protein
MKFAVKLYKIPKIPADLWIKPNLHSSVLKKKEYQLQQSVPRLIAGNKVRFHSHSPWHLLGHMIFAFQC